MSRTIEWIAPRERAVVVAGLSLTVALTWALLLAGGVMNLWWVAATAAFILVEKIAVLGAPVGRAASGVGLVLAGAIALAVM